MQLVDKYRPMTLDAFAGVERPRAIFTAFLKKPYESAWLLLGPSGTGKTTMAFSVAFALGAKQEIGGGIYHVPARQCDLEQINHVVEQCHYTPMLGCPWNVVIIDECDRMTLAAQETLLSKLDCADPPPNTIWLMTCNDTEALHERFLSRLRKIQFTTDNLLEPGTAHLKKVWQAEIRAMKLDFKPAAPDFEAMLRTAKFNVREALMLLETELLCPSPASAAPAHSSTASKGSTVVGKGNGAGTVYTIGMNGFNADSMAETFRGLNAAKLIDCCWKPNRALRANLSDEQYEWAGDRLSAGRTASEIREKGYAWLTSLVMAGKSVLIMYREEEPWKCRRHSEIACDLLNRGIDCVHVYNDELIQASELQAALDEDREYKAKKWRLPKAV